MAIRNDGVFPMRYWLKSIRESKKLTAQEVADEAGISQGYLTTIENGQRGANLPPRTAKAIAEVLWFDWTRFYEGEDAMEDRNGEEDGVASGLP